MSKTLVLIKPDGVERNLIGEIIKRFEDGGLKVQAIEMVQVSEDLVRKHYKSDDREYVIHMGHIDTAGWSEEQLESRYQEMLKVVLSLQNFLISGPVVKMILEGDDAVLKVRSIVGKTDPANSPEGSIRGDLGVDSFEKANQEGRTVYNLVHASGTDEEAAEEISLWFPELP